MKKRDGFTLIELVIGMAIMAIIFGGIVYIFGITTSSAQMGLNQQKAYEDARTTMDLLKTSLRYADKTTINPLDPTNTISTMTYDCLEFDKHFNVDEGSEKTYSITVSLQEGTNPDGSAWKDKNKRQIVITGGPVTPVKYPRYEENSVLTSNSFPITVDDSVYGSDVDLYKITLPVQYKHNGTYKQDTLISNVTPTDYTNTNLSSDTDPDAIAKAKAEVLLTAVTAMYSDTSTRSKLRTGGGTGNYTSNISSAAFNQKGLSGVTKNLHDYISQNNAAGLATLSNTAWIIVPIGANGNILSGNSLSASSSIYGWRVFIAKNVINDVNNAFKTYSDTEYAAEAAKGNYIIRGGYGFLAYTYDSVGQSYSAQADIRLGYMTGFRYTKSSTDMVMISYNSWVNAYTDLKNYYKALDNLNSYNYIEDQYNSQGTKSVTGSHLRIDYDVAGAEYTVETCNAAGNTYHYDSRK